MTKSSSSELQKRIVTGIVGGAGLIFLVLYGGSKAILGFAALLTVFMMGEMAVMLFKLGDSLQKRRLLLAVGVGAQIAFALLGEFGLDTMLMVFLALSLYFLLTARRHTGDSYSAHLNEGVWASSCVLYIVGLNSYFPKIHGLQNGPKWTLLLLFIVWAGDTGAYFAGRTWGRRKLYETISPKKTWEGAVGGLLAGYIVVLLNKVIWMDWVPWTFVAVAPLLVGGIAQLGDLWESYIKRVHHVKDSGSVLPGHGGLLDRFDGVLFGLPVMYVLIRLLA